MEKSGVSTNMASFEKVFEDLDVTSATINGALDNVGGISSSDQSAVTELLNQMQAEMALKDGGQVQNAGMKKIPG